MIYGFFSCSNCCPRGSPSVVVTDSKHEVHKADLLIAADGTFSQVFKSLYPASDNRPVYRGYRVYRGYSEASKDSSQEKERRNEGEGYTSTSTSSSSSSSTSRSSSSLPQGVSSRSCEYGFQTWGPSFRFACVPTVSGNAWYIAVASKEKVGATSCGAESDNTSPRRRSYTGPFSNSSVTVGKEEFNSLRAVLNEWHSPIKQILDGTVHTPEPNTKEQGTGVRVCDAYAFNCRETVRSSFHAEL